MRSKKEGVLTVMSQGRLPLTLMSAWERRSVTKCSLELMNPIMAKHSAYGFRNRQHKEIFHRRIEPRCQGLNDEKEGAGNQVIAAM